MMIDWLVIGIGDITTKRVLPAILAEPRSRLAGIVTRDPRKAEPYGVQAWTDLEPALASGFDAVYVASPVALHAPQTIAALNAGKHVLCEKPMAMNYAEAQSMQTAAEKAGRVLGIAYYRRTYPKVNRAKQLIAEDAIGKPVLAELSCHSQFAPGQSSGREWLFDPALSGGGPLFDIGSHRIDLLNYFFGQPERVSGHLSNAVHQMAVEDNATVMIDYGSGVRGIVDVRWHSDVVRDECRIIGTRGEIEMSPLNSATLAYPGGAEELPPHANLHFPCVQNFVNALLDGEELRATGQTSMVTDWVTEQVQSNRSAASAARTPRY
jgi:1,5-anhydro-D-fructose reductase (1,5-anhydro-D-mannitol-forming)